MSKTTELLQHIADAWYDGDFNEDYLRGAIRALDSIPEVYHDDVLQSLFKPEENEQEAEQPENYLAVKTFDSSVLNVGDEVTDGSVKAVVTRCSDEVIYYVRDDGVVGYYGKCHVMWHRTGRNFPAIPAILGELKK